MKTRTTLVLGTTLLAVALALLVPPMPQPMAYHDFADERGAYGIVNALNVTSNLVFVLAGIACLVLAVRPKTCFGSPAERLPYVVFAVGLLLTGAGSCVYHLAPSNEALFWDRLPMVIAFMSLIAAQMVDRVGVRIGLAALGPLLFTGVGSVVYWIVTERQLRGNVIPYAVLQAYAVVALFAMAALYPSRYTHGRLIFVVFLAYVMAKVFELFDREILDLTGTVSGHTLKHVAAGLAGLPVAYMLGQRRPVGPVIDPTTDAATLAAP